MVWEHLSRIIVVVYRINPAFDCSPARGQNFKPVSRQGHPDAYLAQIPQRIYKLPNGN